MLKRFRLFAVALMATGTLWACSDNDPEPEPVPDKPTTTESYLTVESVSTELVAAEGGEVTFTVKSDRVPTGTTDADWAKRKSSDRTGDVSTFVFTVNANDGDARQANVTFKAGQLTASAVIKQEAAPKVEPPTPPVVGDENTSVGYARALGLGWNLGNQFDASNNGVASETAWGNPKTTQQLFNKLVEAGITSVRIPITWLGQFGEAPDYTINQAWLDRIAEVVGYAEQAGLRAIINIHHDGANSSNWLNVKDAATNPKLHASIKQQIKAIWTQIAQRFSDKGQFLMFESFNEIHDGGWGWGENRRDGGKQYGVLNEWNQVFVDAVRATGGNNATRFLGVPGYCTNPDLTIEHFVKPTDTAEDRILVAVHYYDPNEFTLTAKFTEWGHTGSASKKATYGDENDVKNTFERLANKFTKAGTGLYIGEFGCTTRSAARDELFRLYYLEYVAKAGHDKGFGMILWDNGSRATGNEAHGYFDHATGAFMSTKAQKAIEAMVKAYSDADPSYTLDTVYNTAP
ncbi:MAG: cellulase family glycosylhydrolase [Muribaculaceae bacterium]|nr:cellulase family glycosylhydrolase [Muribaculaceae bacterium]